MQNPDAGWIDAAERAASKAELVDVVRAYVASWNPVDVGVIPKDVRPGYIAGVDDVIECAYPLEIARCGSVGSDDANPAVERMAAFFSAAARRAATLSSPVPTRAYLLSRVEARQDAG